LFHLANKIKQTEINHDIDTYLPNINEVLEEFSKEELIKKVFSVEFTRFYNYYKKAKDLNVSAGDMSEGSKDTVRYFINIGGKDDFDWMSLKDFLKEMLHLDQDDLYKVDVKESFSFFNTDTKHQELVMDFFKDFELEGRRVSVEISKDTGRGKRGGRDRDRGGSRGGFKSRGGERRGGSDRRDDRRSSGSGDDRRGGGRSDGGRSDRGSSDRGRSDSGNSGFKGRSRRSDKPAGSGTGGRRRRD
jgi:ATP-dependent RNA helicase DeaD